MSGLKLCPVAHDFRCEIGAPSFVAIFPHCKIGLLQVTASEGAALSFTRPGSVNHISDAYLDYFSHNSKIEVVFL